MKRYFTIYKEQMLTGLKTAMAYRTDFVLSSLITVVSNVLFPLVTVMIYATGASFEGWSIWEVVLLQSIFSMAIGVCDLLFTTIVWDTMSNVQNGTLDVILLKPMSCLGVFLCRAFNMEGIFVIVGSVLMFGLSVSHINPPDIWMWAGFFLLFLAGLLVMLGMVLFMAATSFKWVANSRIPEIYESVEQFGKYPYTIFPKAIVGITSFLFPVAMIGCFPACALLGRADWWMFAAIVPCVLFLLLGIYIYQHMVRLYEGVGG